MGIKETLHRKPSLSYDCPHCGERLKSPLMDASTEDTCPHCQQSFTVPGEKEKQTYEAQKAADRAEKQEAETRRLAEREAETRKFRELESRSRSRETAQRKAAAKAFQKAMPAGWLPAALAVIGGAMLFYFAFMYDTSVPTGSSAYGGASRVNNTGLLQNRLIGCITGVCLFVGGIAIDLVTRAMVKIHKDKS